MNIDFQTWEIQFPFANNKTAVNFARRPEEKCRTKIILANLLHSDDSFSSTDIKPSFKLLFFMLIKSRGNTSLERNDTRLEVREKLIRFMTLDFSVLNGSSTNWRIQFNRFNSSSSILILKITLSYVRLCGSGATAVLIILKKNLHVIYSGYFGPTLNEYFVS